MVLRSYQSTDREGGADSGLDLQVIVPRRSIDELLLRFEQAILDGRLRAGQRLPPERELAQRFGVSRSSLREALRVLEMMGVLSARRGSGSRSGSRVEVARNGLASLLPLYAKLRAVPLADLVDVRVAIEVMTARGAAARGAEAARALEPIADQMRELSSHEDFLQADTRFHLEIAQHSGNSLAPLLMESIREAMAREMLAAFRRLAEWEQERDQLVAEHEAIRRLIGAGDAGAAGEAIERHIRDFYARSGEIEVG